MRASLPSAFFAASLLAGLAALTVAFEPPSPGAPARLELISEPAGASVWLDGRELGKTPVNQVPSAGKHKVKFQMAGYAPEELDLTCKAGESQSVHRRLHPLPGTLSIRDVNRVKLCLGPGIPKELKGKGPWKLAPGHYEVTASRDRIPAKPRRIEIKPDGRLEISLDWPALPVVPPLAPPRNAAGSSSPPPVPPAQPYSQPPSAAYVTPRYNNYRPPQPAYRPTEPLFTPIPPSHYEPPPPPPPRSYPGGGEPIFTPLP
ncbi:MAG: PEGA domain-containing protein [Vulcanimicrobiota bacterium]